MTSRQGRWSVAAVAALLAAAPAADAAGVGRERAVAIAKRAASARGRALRHQLRAVAVARGVRPGRRHPVGVPGRHGRPVLGRGDRQRDERATARAKGGRLVLRLSRMPGGVLGIGLLTAGLLVAGGALAFAVADGPRAYTGGNDRATVTTTEFGTVIVRQVDRRRDLIFELNGSRGWSDSLYMRLTRDAPKATRQAILTRPLAGTCHVPGSEVHEFPGRWNERFKQYGTVLWTDDDAVSVIERATDCVLSSGGKRSAPERAFFDDPPFSRVRLR